MSTREDIIATAKAYGWVEEEPRRLPWLDTFAREVTLPITSHLQRLANHAGYPLKEEVQVWYTPQKDILRQAVLHTPCDQAAMDGSFVSVSDRAEGKNKKGQVIAWFAMTRNY